MFHKSLFFTLTLCLFVIATPIRQSKKAVHIKINDRRSLQDENGVFNRDAAIQEIQRIKGKHALNIETAKRNAGKNFLSVSQSQSTQSASSNQPIHTVPLDDVNLQGSDIEFSGQLSIGNPPVNFSVNVDTGSSDLWVPNILCPADECGQKHRYNPNNSLTAQSQPGNFSILYGDGSTASGPIFTDDVTMGGVTIKNQFFSPATQLSSFLSEAVDGIIGMAFPSLSQLEKPTFFNNAAQQGKVNNVFAMKLARRNSTLILGDAPKSFFTGDIEYHQVNTSIGFWELTNGSVTVGSNTVASGFSTIIDSGTSFMFGVPSDVAKVYAAIPGSQLIDNVNGIYTYPCNSPTVSFSWEGGREWNISADNFNLGPFVRGGSSCVGALMGQELFGDGVTWLLGDSFMKNVFSVFSFGNNSVGFGELAS